MLPQRLRWCPAMLALPLQFALLLPAARAAPRSVPYSDFMMHVRQGAVTEVTIAGLELEAVYRDGSTASVSLPPTSARLSSVLIQYGVKVNIAPPLSGGGRRLLIRVAPPLLVLLAILLLVRRGAGGGRGLLSIGESPARRYLPGSQSVTMADVAGMAEIKEELQELIQFLREPHRFRALGARMPRGILLCGPPGTGKTLLARAVAGEAGVGFFSISGSDFVEVYAGVGAARVRSLFEQARRSAPCVVFIDEIDALARRRTGGTGGGVEEREQTVNQLLVEMDGFGSTDAVVVMAATNRADILDPAILRPGRFDRQLQVDPPDRLGRREILAVHARGKPLADDVSLDQLAAITIGFTGADLANLLNEAALLAARGKKRVISAAEVTQAYERIAAGGPGRPRMLSPGARLRTAYHEAGHALVSRWLWGAEQVLKLSIVPRGRALGYVLYHPGEEERLLSRHQLLERLSVLMAGRAAEEIGLAEVSAGAADDLQRATDLARAMVVQWGMAPAIGPLSIDGGEPASEETLRAVDRAVRQLVTEGYERALGLLRANRAALERVVSALMAKESLSGPELDQLLTAG